MLPMSCQYQKPLSVAQVAQKKPSQDNWRLSYVTGNIFSCPESESLAHCISADCRVGAGIAVKFKQEFGGIEELKQQNKLTGECAVLERGGRFVYYLITKSKAGQKPSYGNLRLSLENMKSHCVQNGITRISMPRIGCGLDRLKWERVAEILEQVFKNTNISITVYSLPMRAADGLTFVN